MPSVTYSDSEARVAFFERQPLNDAVFEARIRLARGQTSRFHQHSVTKDTFYVLSGTLTVMVIIPEGRADADCFGMLGGAIVSRRPAARRAQLVQAALVAGETMVIHPRVAHCTANHQAEPCDFLCLEGAGRYDFIDVEERAVRTEMT